MTLEEAISKVQKLLSLSKSSNPHEAGLAAAKAQEIMFQYHLSHQDIKEQDSTAKGTIDFELFYYTQSPKEDKDMWRMRLINSVATTNFAKVIRSGPGKMVIVAREADIEHVKYLYVYLAQTIDRLCIQLKSPGVPKDQWVKSFCKGAVDAVHISLIEQQQRDQTQQGGTALVLRSNKAVQDRYKELYPKTLKTRSGKQSLDSAAYNTGYREGSKIGINRGLDPQKRGEINGK